MVVYKRDAHHHHHAQHGKLRLANNELITVAVVIIGKGITGRKQHNQADGQKDQDHGKKHHIHFSSGNPWFSVLQLRRMFDFFGLTRNHVTASFFDDF